QCAEYDRAQSGCAERRPRSGPAGPYPRHSCRARAGNANPPCGEPALLCLVLQLLPCPSWYGAENPRWALSAAAAPLVPPAGSQVRVLHCDSPPPPINFAHHAGTDTGTLALVNIAVDAEPRMRHRHVRPEEAHMHLRRLAGARSEWPVGAVQTLHQVPE